MRALPPSRIVILSGRKRSMCEKPQPEQVQNKWGLSRRISCHTCETIHSPLIKGMTGDWETLQAFPAWGRGTASAVDRVLSLAAQMRPLFLLYYHLSFIPCLPYPPLRGTFPSRGRLMAREYHPLKRKRSRHLHFSFEQSFHSGPRDNALWANPPPLSDPPEAFRILLRAFREHLF